MALDIFWTKDAIDGFEQVLDYIDKSFGELHARKYMRRIDIALNQLSNFPKIGVLQDIDLDIRAYIVFKRSTILYRVKSNQLILLHIFDNRIGL